MILVSFSACSDRFVIVLFGSDTVEADGGIADTAGVRGDGAVLIYVSAAGKGIFSETGGRAAAVMLSIMFFKKIGGFFEVVWGILLFVFALSVSAAGLWTLGRFARAGDSV